jgi:hypothetical protein
MTGQPPREIICDVAAFAPDIASVDTLARLRLTARREGLELRLEGVSRELGELLAFTGLAGVLGVEAGREAEQGEERLGVEEERHLDDPAV